MKFFDVRSSLEIPDLPAESFNRKLVGTLDRYNIRYEKLHDGKVIFKTSLLQFSEWKHWRLIFRGVSSGEIEFRNQDENLIVKFNLSLMSTRVIALVVVLLMITVSILWNDYAPLIMAGWIIILYFIIADTARYRFKKWFSRFTR